MIDRNPWRPGADPLPLTEIVEQAHAWANNGKGNSVESCRLVAFSYAQHAGRQADAAIRRMIDSAKTGGPANGN